MGAAVRVVCGPGNSLVAALRAALAGRARLRVWDRVPPPGECAIGDLLVIDLEDVGAHPPSSKTAASLQRARVILVFGEHSLDPWWAEAMRDPAISAVRLSGSERRRSVRSVVTLVLQELRGPHPEAVTELVLAREPTLRPLSACVAAVCEHPWDVRRPADLAARVHLSLKVLRHHCRALGFSRVEHFILCVRMVGYEQLVVRARVTPKLARRLVGLTDDWSNLRRQLERATRASPAAARCLGKR